VIQPNDFIDVSRAAAAYVTKFREVDGGAPRLVEAGEATPTMDEWKSARALLVRLQQQATSVTGHAVKVVDAQVRPVGIDATWTSDGFEHEGTLLAVNLVPSPGARLHTLNGSFVLWPGQLHIIPHTHPWCFVNYGPCAAAFLLVRLVGDVPSQH